MPVANAKEIFEAHLPNKLKTVPDLAQKINATFKFDVIGDQAGTWFVDLTKPGGEVSQNTGEAQCTVTIKDTDLVDIVNGKLNGQMAFMTGKLKVKGNMGLALKLGTLLG